MTAHDLKTSNKTSKRKKSGNQNNENKKLAEMKYKTKMQMPTNRSRMILKASTYNEVIQEYRNLQCSTRDAIKILHDKFTIIPEKTLDCIVYQEIQRKTKWSLQNHRSASTAANYYQEYKKAVESGEAPGFLLKMANKVDLCPALMARIILEQHYADSNDEETPASRQRISKLMKETYLIDDKHLSVEVHLCNLADNVYGPITDALRHGIGAVYEEKLKDQLRKMGLHFLDENELRNRGYDKTPDIKLEIPVAIDGQVINWIESKALFGDRESHNGYLKDQYWSYWNRFGPGLVIYWFGYVEDIDTLKDKGILVSDHMPQVTDHMEPTLVLQ